MSDSDKWVVLVEKLVEATRSGKAKWELRSDLAGELPVGERISHVYVTRYLDQWFRIYEYEWKYYTDEETWEWSSDTKLEFIDAAGHSLFAVPRSPGVHELLEAVQYQNANVDGFLEKIGAA